MRSYESIEAAKSALRNRQTEAAVSGYPPGYITGFKLTIDEHGQLVVGTGAANVAGRPVNKGVSYTLSAGDWNCSKVFGMPYSLYLDSTGAFHVDSQDAVYTETYFGYYHPSMSTWRNIGRLFVALSTGLIIYCSTGDPDTFGGRTVVVACPGYRGDYDYLMDADNGQPQIQRAIDYVYQQYGGGRVELTEGDGTITASVVLYSNCELYLRRGCTIYKKGAFDGITATGTLGNELSGLFIGGGGKVASATGDDTSKTYELIDLTYVNNSSVKDLSIEDADLAALLCTSCQGMEIASVYVNGVTGPGYGIAIYSGTGASSIRDCIVTGVSGNGITVNGGNKTIVSNNICKDNTTGIALDATPGASDYCSLYSNRCEDGDIGISIGAGCDSSLVVGNYCFNNGSDTGIANTNTHNFADAGTGTKASANSWQ